MGHNPQNLRVNEEIEEVVNTLKQTEEGDGTGNAMESEFWMVLFLFAVLKKHTHTPTHKHNIKGNRECLTASTSF